jgi:hypothetical protein
MSSAVPTNSSTPLRSPEQYDLVALRSMILLSNVAGGGDASPSDNPLDSPLADGVVPVPKCEAEQIFESTNGSKRVLLCMCIGLTALPDEVDGVVVVSDTPPRKLGDTSVGPYNASKNKKYFKPVTKDLVSELLRRYAVFGTPKAEQMRPKNKVLSVLYTWLQNNPITDPADVLFLRSEERKFHDSVALAIEESNNAATQVPAGVIFTSTADLRLIHCLMEVDVKESFLARHNVMTREELDGRNSPERPMTWTEAIAAKFNDPTFTPSSEVLPELHGDYEDEIDLRRSNCPCDVTADQVKSWVASHKTKLLLLIGRWELSGNGDGQRIEGSASFGMIDTPNHLIFGGDNRSDFLKNERSPLLYFWYMCDKYEILPQVLSLLPEEMGFSTLRGRPSTVQELRTVGSSKKQRRQHQLVAENNRVLGGPLSSLEKVIESMSRFAAASSSAVTVSTSPVADDRSEFTGGSSSEERTAVDLEIARATASKAAAEVELTKSLAAKGVLDVKKAGLDLVIQCEDAVASMMEKCNSTPDGSESLKAFYLDRLSATKLRLLEAEAAYNLLM